MCEWCKDSEELYYAYNVKFKKPYLQTQFTHAVDENGLYYDEMILREPSKPWLKAFGQRAWGKTTLYEQAQFKWAPDKMPEIDDSWVDDWLRKFGGK